jgi:hypothetical protein
MGGCSSPLIQSILPSNQQTYNGMNVNMTKPTTPVNIPTYNSSYAAYQPTSLPSQNVPAVDNSMANVMAGMNLVNYNPGSQLSGLSGLSQIGIGAPQASLGMPTITAQSAPKVK